MYEDTFNSINDYNSFKIHIQITRWIIIYCPVIHDVQCNDTFLFQIYSEVYYLYFIAHSLSIMMKNVINPDLWHDWWEYFKKVVYKMSYEVFKFFWNFLLWASSCSLLAALFANWVWHFLGHHTQNCIVSEKNFIIKYFLSIFLFNVSCLNSSRFQNTRY